jgi:hypothetical protein
MHANEINNRITYAQRIVTFVDREMPGASAESLTMLGEASWRRIANLAGERVPSDATVSVVIALVRGRELAAEAVRSALGLVR